MSRAKLIGTLVLVALALAAWRSMGPRADVPPVEASTPAPNSLPPAREKRAQAPGISPALPSVVTPEALNERTLVGTKWERDGFSIEFGADGKLLIVGRPRAQWRVEGSRVLLYRDTTGEEHWLDVVGDKLLWAGQEIGRVP